MYEIVHHRLEKKIYFVQKLVLTILGDFDELVMMLSLLNLFSKRPREKKKRTLKNLMLTLS